MPKTEHDALPALPYIDWQSTKDTLHLYAQIVGKVKLAHAPKLNHWWHVTYRPYARGLTTGPMPRGYGAFEFAFDLLDHELIFMTSAGERETLMLRDGLAVSDFYEWAVRTLREHDIEPNIRAVPYECMSTIPFAEDRAHAHYDRDAVARFYRVLTFAGGVFERFRGHFYGKSTPVHFFWHSFDLALTRFSGRRAPEASGASKVMQEAYSHEVASFGFWPGDEKVKEPSFYAYASPEPAELAKEPLEPSEAKWAARDGTHLALLSYDSVRRAADPARTLLQFLESAYRAASKRGSWDEEALRTPWARVDE